MAGQKEEVVFFLPGMFCGAWFWRYYLRIAGQGVEGHCLELPGLYGEERPHLTFGSEVSAYARIIREIAGGRDVCLVGHSYGAQHALALARRDDVKVVKMVFAAPALGRWWMIGAFKRVMTSILLRQGFRAVFMSEEELAWAYENLPDREFGEDPRKIEIRLRDVFAQVLAVALRMGRGLQVDEQVPTLVVWPEGDRVLKRPEQVDSVVEGGHYLFLARKDVWNIIRLSLKQKTR